jgi:phospholipase C
MYRKIAGGMPVVALTAILVVLVGCGGLQAGNNGGGTTTPPVTTPPPPAADIHSVNHIIFMVQENRSFDHYFGHLPDYWQANGFPAQQIDVMSATASNPSADGLSTVTSYHLKTVCHANLSPSWNESHVDWNRQNPTSATATMDGFTFTAAAYAMNSHPGEPDVTDKAGIRAMGYYDSSDLNYYYFMASNFATSDRWFSPAMTRTQPNRMYLLSATSAGHVYPLTAALTNKTIFEALDDAGVSWKIYETDPGTSYLNMFQPYATQNASKVRPISEYMTDVQNGTLPSVALIEGGYASGRDEHPNENVQKGSTWVSGIINPLLTSPSWKDSVFILTFDEGGAMYDHVPPQPAVNPDGIAPSDLAPTDICAANTGANCDFNFTGFRVPMIVISPFTKKNFVSHTSADYTAILKLIETRFNVPALTKRDAAQMDMTEFFDFTNVPWKTPPTPPVQVTGAVCDFDTLQ